MAQLVRLLGPYGAAFMAGWTPRGAPQYSLFRRSVSVFIEAIGAAAVAATSRKFRRRSQRNSQAGQAQLDLEALVEELRTGGAGAQRAAAKHLAARPSSVRMRSQPNPHRNDDGTSFAFSSAAQKALQHQPEAAAALVEAFARAELVSVPTVSSAVTHSGDDEEWAPAAKRR